MQICESNHCIQISYSLLGRHFYNRIDVAGKRFLFSFGRSVAIAFVCTNDTGNSSSSNSTTGLEYRRVWENGIVHNYHAKKVALYEIADQKMPLQFFRNGGTKSPSILPGFLLT